MTMTGSGRTNNSRHKGDSFRRIVVIDNVIFYNLVIVTVSLGDLSTNDKTEVVYYESRKSELKIRIMNEGRCDDRLKGRVEEST